MAESKTTPDGVHVSVGIGLMGSKPTVTLYVSEDETDCVLPATQNGLGACRQSDR
jgi:hypothetical protein